MLYLSEMDWALFFSALISSTLFPGGSEALLLYKLHEATSEPLVLITSATIGNILGSLITYAMGRFGIAFAQKWLRLSTRRIESAQHHFQRFGHLALLFAWLPIVGDPLCFVAGVFRYNVWWFLILISLGKCARYVFLAWVFI